MVKRKKLKTPRGGTVYVDYIRVRIIAKKAVVAPTVEDIPPVNRMNPSIAVVVAAGR